MPEKHAEGFRTQMTTHPSGLATLPNERPDVATRMEHVLEIPRCCPASRNPQPGSTLTIRYRVEERILEVYTLKAYIASFQGGHADGTRNMESMIGKIAADAANATGVRVFIHAHLFLAPEQQMRITVTAEPDGAALQHLVGRLQGK